MAGTITRDVEYTLGDARMLGLLCTSATAAAPAPGVVLVHDAFGLGDDMIAIAHRVAELGFSVFAADVWGDRVTPGSNDEIGPLIGGMVRDREQWIARVAAAHEFAAALPEVSGAGLVSMGYCFGGSSALEYARVGGAVRAVIAIHPGLDLLEFDWSAVRDRMERGEGSAPQALVIFGADDPMATPEQWRQAKTGMTGAGVDWELDLYSGTVHAFTSPKAAHSPDPSVAMYHPRNAERAWRATERLLEELRSEGDG